MLLCRNEIRNILLTSRQPRVTIKAMLTRTQALKILTEDRLKAVQTSVERGFRTYLEYPARFRRAHATRTRRSITYDHIVETATEVLESQPGVTLVRTQGLVVFDIDRRLLLRFKHLDEQRRSSNISTMQIQEFRGQRPLPGMPARAVHVEAGYQLNELETAIENIVVICPNGSRIEWDIDVYAANPQAEIVPFYEANPEQVVTKFRPRVQKSKREDEPESV